MHILIGESMNFKKPFSQYQAFSLDLTSPQQHLTPAPSALRKESIRFKKFQAFIYMNSTNPSEPSFNPCFA